MSIHADRTQQITYAEPLGFEEARKFYIIPALTASYESKETTVWKKISADRQLINSTKNTPGRGWLENNVNALSAHIDLLVQTVKGNSQPQQPTAPHADIMAAIRATEGVEVVHSYAAGVTEGLNAESQAPTVFAISQKDTETPEQYNSRLSTLMQRYASESDTQSSVGGNLFAVVCTPDAAEALMEHDCVAGIKDQHGNIRLLKEDRVDPEVLLQQDRLNKMFAGRV